MKKNIQGEIIIYTTAQGPKIDIKLEKEMIWLTQKQMSELFEKDVRTINEHIQNVFKERELFERATIRKFRIVQNEGGRSVSRDIDFYNLDVIISVGYRVNSKRATQFRIWATKILKEYLVKGYSINQKRLISTDKKLSDLQKTIQFLTLKAKKKTLKGQEAEILDLISNYSKTLALLEQYDQDRIGKVKGRKSKFVLNYSQAVNIVEIIKDKKNPGLFGKEFKGKFEGIINNIHQTFAKQELYKTIEDKAAHILYLIIKDHPFTDGNKRIGSFLFVYFLDKNDYLYKKNGEKKINDNALVALALLIAESKPKEKDILIKIVANLITN